ncbi:hypothetical protein LIER_36215 [Lithospermum erythrorhizon]|uniref:Uncharacterized protein n=1 Tax=Lithospermum erythrorhizon TaxID=34254 RepID=A0AAV3P6L6_LITER
MDVDEWNELDRHVLGVIKPCLSRNVAAGVAKRLLRKKVLKEKEVEKEVTTSVPKKANAQDGARSSVHSKLHNLDHVRAPESQPEDPFANMSPLEEIGSDE